MKWMLLPLRRYADFEGRSSRMEYWMFTLGVLIVEVLLVTLLVAGGGLVPDEGGGLRGLTMIVMGLFVLFILAIFVPGLAVQVRRFHDQDKSGWMVLIGLIPYIGGLIVLVFMCLPGTPGANAYGEDPRDIGANLGDVFS
jgi:uncharacterized membrane protein YhaH (DUF805 family)